MKRLKLAKVKQAHHAIDICTGEKDRGYKRAGRQGCYRQLGSHQDLLAEIGRGVQQKPVRRIRGNRDLRLRARTNFQGAVAETATVWTATIPLGETAPGCGAEDFYAHSGLFTTDRCTRSMGLELRVGVGADFAVEVDFFVLRGNPFHDDCSFGL